MSKCNRCKYEHNSAIDEPCVSCSALTKHFEPKEHSSNCTMSDRKFKNKDYGFDEIDMVNHPQHYSPLDVYLVSLNKEGYPVRAFWDGKDFGDGMFKLDVKAWMPLPKPYEEKEND